MRGFKLKYLMKRLLRRYLPDELVDQPKRGFMVPMGSWLRRELQEPLLDCLSEASVKRRGYFRS